MMKRLVLLLCLSSMFSYSQVKESIERTKKNAVKNRVRDTVLFKGVNKLLIKNDKSINQNLFLLQSAFLKRGYKAKIDRKHFIVFTADSIIEHGRAVYVLNGLVNKDSIELTGKYNVKVVTSMLGEKEDVFNYNIEYSGAKKALAKRLFALLNDIAGDFHGKIIFIKEVKRKKGTIF